LNKINKLNFYSAWERSKHDSLYIFVTFLLPFITLLLPFYYLFITLLLPFYYLFITFLLPFYYLFITFCYISEQINIFIQAVGGPGRIMPPNVGFRIGKNAGKYTALQIHYDNPNMWSGRTDSSGVTLYVSYFWDFFLLISNFVTF
jgi:hypothetical protein